MTTVSHLELSILALLRSNGFMAGRHALGLETLKGMHRLDQGNLRVLVTA